MSDAHRCRPSRPKTSNGRAARRPRRRDGQQRPIRPGAVDRSSPDEPLHQPQHSSSGRRSR
ncbi:hypothetical protein NK6_4996 [Bradyrhizobium diazoefficiens]|uniref:Uncharacterized protein n=1 Tax=Bradyrhizobium diazoefficiens TaxID=1355477 RepID=A0A0E3VUX2_9BRAD|nr:hypothetical protein NK6_4996 [Bradyrhizobium diazoefficiens]